MNTYVGMVLQLYTGVPTPRTELPRILFKLVKQSKFQAGRNPSRTLMCHRTHAILSCIMRSLLFTLGETYFIGKPQSHDHLDENTMPLPWLI